MSVCFQEWLCLSWGVSGLPACQQWGCLSGRAQLGDLWSRVVMWISHTYRGFSDSTVQSNLLFVTFLCSTEQGAITSKGQPVSIGPQMEVGTIVVMRGVGDFNLPFFHPHKQQFPWILPVLVSWSWSRPRRQGLTRRLATWSCWLWIAEICSHYTLRLLRRPLTSSPLSHSSAAT